MKRSWFLSKSRSDNPLISEVQEETAKKDAQDFKGIVHLFLDKYKALSEKDEVTTLEQQLSLAENLVSVLTDIVHGVKENGLRVRSEETGAGESNSEAADTPSGEADSGTEATGTDSGDESNTGDTGGSDNQLKSFFVFKQLNGKYRWVGIVSNNFTDRHAEIISKDAHLRFVNLVNTNQVSYPVLRFHHIRTEDKTLDSSIVIGKSDFVEFDEQSGMLIASGEFENEYEEIGENLSKSDDVWGMSHGMPVESIKRDKAVKNIIREYIDVEFTLLETRWAANPLTTFM